MSFSFCNSSYIHVVHRIMWRQQSCMKDVDNLKALPFLLVGQDVNKGHWKDPLPFRLSFDMPDLQGENRVVRQEALAAILHQAQQVRAGLESATDLEGTQCVLPAAGELQMAKGNRQHDKGTAANLRRIQHSSRVLFQLRVVPCGSYSQDPHFTHEGQWPREVQ